MNIGIKKIVEKDHVHLYTLVTKDSEIQFGVEI